MILTALLAALAAPPITPSGPATDTACVFAVVEADGRVDLEKFTLEPNEPLLLAWGGGEDVVEVILPPGPGGSGSIARAEDRGTAEVVLRAGAIQATLRSRSGEEWQRPPIALDELRGLALRVSVTDAEGHGSAFTISGWRDVRRDPIGPVIDTFAGLVPMQAGDHAIFTDTMRVRTGPAASGVAPLIHDRYVFAEGQTAGGGRGLFILDTGGADTVVSRSFLPEGAGIVESQMIEYSSSGKRTMKYSPGGATGKVQGVVGHAHLDQLAFGELVFSEVPVAVFDEVPQVFGREVVGILGLDLLRRAEVATIEYAGEAPVLRLAGTPTSENALATLPFTYVSNHVVVRGEIGEALVDFILDTGAPSTFLDGLAARTSGVVIDTEDERQARGLSAKTVAMHPGRARELVLGAARTRDVDVFVSDLPVFDRLRGRDQLVGLLGNSTLDRFAGMEIDFHERVLRLLE